MARWSPVTNNGWNGVKFWDIDPNYFIKLGAGVVGMRWTAIRAALFQVVT
jgi:hypothetical protein